jgi:hypothetical protein
MKNYRDTIRLNVETAIPSSQQVAGEIHKWLAAGLIGPWWIQGSVASVTAYEDVLTPERAA